jgi:helix-turn-helix protein
MGKPKLNSKKWYTPAQAAPFLKITPETVKKHCRGGALKGKRVGAKKQWMIPGTELAKKRREWELDGIEH